MAGIDIGSLFPEQPFQAGSGSYTVEVDYGTNPDKLVGTPLDLPEFFGTAPTGTPPTSQIWIIRKFSYDSEWRVTSKTVAIGAWTNRANLTYA